MTTVERKIDDKERDQALNIDQSVLLDANAGAGKTHLLIERILRLLLNGNEPSSILCLTFTRAACREMKGRIIDRLYCWGCTMTDEELFNDLKRFLQQDPSDHHMRRARQLLYICSDRSHAVRVYTIHGFCQDLARNFSDNASVCSDFVIMDDAQKIEFFDSILNGMIKSDSVAIKQAMEAISNEIRNHDGWYEWIREFMIKGQKFLFDMHRGALSKEYWRNLERSLQTSFSKRTRYPSDNWKREWAKLNHDVVYKLWRTMVCKNDSWPYCEMSDLPELWEEEYDAMFVKVEKYGEVKCRRLKSDILSSEELQWVRQEQNRVYEKIQRLQTEKNHLHISSMEVVLKQIANRYAQMKKQAITMDYDDLILSTLHMLQAGETKENRLHQYLKSEIRHVLVDEAQDNNFFQWELVKNLANILFNVEASEDNDRAVGRTIFITGDLKQSIYRFQGARPEHLAPVVKVCQELVRNAGGKFYDSRIRGNMRSGAKILQFVDRVFENNKDSYFSDLQHVAYRPYDGYVELWPIIAPDREKSKSCNDDECRDDVYEVLANRVADRILQICDDTYLQSCGRKARPEDILILLRKREGKVLPALYKALRSKNIEIQPDSKLSLVKQLIIMDYLAILRFLLLPEDDLNTAIVAKSFVGCCSDDLLLIIQSDPSKISLWQKMQKFIKPESFDQSDSSVQASLYNLPEKGLNEKDRNKVHNLVRFLRRLQDFYRDQMPSVSELLQRIYQSTYLAMCRYFDEQALQKVQEFLYLGWEYDHRYGGSLQDFVLWCDNIKNAESFGGDQADVTRRGVQITTIHGAKGLQSPVVFVLDMCLAMKNLDKIIISDDGKINLCLQGSDFYDKEFQEEWSEHLRLLYVAITRAQDVLVLAGNARKQEPSEYTWYHMALRAMESLQKFKLKQDVGVLQYGTLMSDQQLHMSESKLPERKDLINNAAPDLKLNESNDEWIQGWSHLLTEDVHVPYFDPEREKTVKSQYVYYDPDDTKLNRNQAIKKGELIHRMLEMYCLKKNQSENHKYDRKYYDEYLHYVDSNLPAAIHDSIMKNVEDIVSSPQWKKIMNIKGMRYPEVKVFGQVVNEFVYRKIDLLIVGKKSVTILDYKYKSNVHKNDSLKMNEYFTLVKNIFADRDIESYIFCLKSGKLEVIDTQKA